MKNHSTPDTRHSFRERYNFWEDRTVGDFVYRFNDYRISRRPVNGTLFSSFLEFDNRSATCREWIRICDEAIKQSSKKEALEIMDDIERENGMTARKESVNG